MAKDYYFILGITPNASQEEVKSAYRRHAKELHPDRYGRDARPFQEVQEAYSTLGDPERRVDYDRHHVPVESSGGIWVGPGPEPLCPYEHQKPEPLIPHSSVADFGEISLTESFQTLSPSSGEIFDWLWSNFGERPLAKAGRIEGLTLTIPITPEEARRGGRARIKIPARVVCPVCQGRGGLDFYECWRCRGAGRIEGEFPAEIQFPPGIKNGYTAQIPLDQYGIGNLHLIVAFRLSQVEDPEA